VFSEHFKTGTIQKEGSWLYQLISIKRW